MTCKVCGKEMPENANFCTECGATVTTVPTAHTEPAYDPGTPIKDPGKGFGIASLILGICGLVFSVSVLPLCCFGSWGALLILFSVPFCLACGIVGLVLGAMGQKKSKAVGLKNSLTNTGIALSGIATGLAGLLMILTILAIVVLFIGFIIFIVIYVVILGGSLASFGILDALESAPYYYYY